MNFIYVKSILIILFLATCVSCISSGNPNYLNDLKSETIYEVTLTFKWTADNHPTEFGDFPPNAHFSSVVGAVYNYDQTLYIKRNLVATRGIKLIAETGATSILEDEIDYQINMGNAHSIMTINGDSKASGEDKTGIIKATDRFHYVSVISMIAPSPDWFIAVINVDLKDSSGNWKSDFSVDMYGYDAGTDSGETFTAADLQTNPPEKITRFSGSNNIVFATVNFKRKIKFQDN